MLKLRNQKRNKFPDGSALWLLQFQQARASGGKKQQNQKVIWCISAFFSPKILN
jgi:hypothetical protein